MARRSRPGPPRMRSMPARRTPRRPLRPAATREAITAAEAAAPDPTRAPRPPGAGLLLYPLLPESRLVAVAVRGPLAPFLLEQRPVLPHQRRLLATRQLREGG